MAKGGGLSQMREMAATRDAVAKELIAALNANTASQRGGGAGPGAGGGGSGGGSGNGRGSPGSDGGWNLNKVFNDRGGDAMDRARAQATIMNQKYDEAAGKDGALGLSAIRQSLTAAGQGQLSSLMGGFSTGLGALGMGVAAVGAATHVLGSLQERQDTILHAGLDAFTSTPNDSESLRMRSQAGATRNAELRDSQTNAHDWMKTAILPDFLGDKETQQNYARDIVANQRATQQAVVPQQIGAQRVEQQFRGLAEMGGFEGEDAEKNWNFVKSVAGIHAQRDQYYIRFQQQVSEHLDSLYKSEMTQQPPGH